MTTNIFLFNLLKPFKKFGGVYSLDQFLKISAKKTFIYIVNTEDISVKIGGHWLLLYFKNNRVELFDSLALGRKNIPTLLIKYCEKNKNKIIFSKVQIQNILSDMCGIYCVGRFLSIILKETSQYYISNFKKDSMKNDKILLRLISKMCVRISILGVNVLK